MKALDHFITQGVLKRLLGEKTLKSLFQTYLHLLLASKGSSPGDTHQPDQIYPHAMGERNNERNSESIQQHTIEQQLVIHTNLQQARIGLTNYLSQDDWLYAHRRLIMDLTHWSEEHLQFLRDVFNDPRFSV